MNLEIHQEGPDQINQEEVQALRVHQVVQADLHQIDRLLHHLRVHQVDQADLADPVVQVVIEIEVRDPVEAGVPVLEKMSNVMTVALN
jgi:hypothetical protein